MPSISTRRSVTDNRFQDRPADGATVEGQSMTFGETNIPFWEESGHEVRICKVTGLRFWSRDPARTTSGDTVEDSYTFIGNPIIDGFPMRGKALKDAMREAFLGYFEQRGIRVSILTPCSHDGATTSI
ncbi:MAG: hypothetical protein ACJZ5A_05050 [Candidatus Thalassarchaeaceae archaeon]